MISKEKNITLVYSERLNRKSGVKKTEGKILSIQMESGQIYQSKIFIDEKGRRLCFLKNQKQGATIFKGFKIIQGLKEKLQL